MNHKNISKKYEEILQNFFHSETMGEYSLDKIKKACLYFGNPQNSFKSIHIAGTNGKGSVAKMIFQILKDTGKKLGVYTSPHIVDICERFETQKGYISQEEFIQYAEKIISYGGGLSYFERCVLLAFLYFRDQGCEYAVIETGLGGRLDATNVITPILSVITSIGYDHKEFLGETLEEISYEKAGIIKQNTPCILYGKNETIQNIASSRNSEIIFPSTLKPQTNLLGKHQQSNAALAYQAGLFLGFGDSGIKKSLSRVRHMGRLDFIRPNLLLDGAHNEDGLKALSQYLNDNASAWESIEYFYASKKGKSVDTLINIFPQVKKWNIIDSEINLLESSDVLKEKFKNYSVDINIISPSLIHEFSKKNSQTLHIIFGSLYVLQEFLTFS